MRDLRMFSQPWLRHVQQWGAASPIASIQYGSIAIPGGSASAAATIASVDVNHATIANLGVETSGNRSDTAFARVALNSATEVIATIAGTAIAATVNYVVVAFRPGVIKSIQRGTFTATAPSSTQAITAVATGQSQATLLGFSAADSGATLTYVSRLSLTNATTLTLNTASSGGIFGYQVVEWY